MNKFGILAWPAHINKSHNPYNHLIYTLIEKEGFPVLEFEFNLYHILKFGFCSQYKILHFHWPTTMLTYSISRQIIRRLFMFKVFLILIKLLNKKVVWTVHNLKDHEAQSTDFEEKLYKILYHYVDGFISLNQSGIEEIKRLATNKRNQSFKYIPHPHYKGYYPNVIHKAEARTLLEIPADKFVFLFLGQIRAYKNVISLIEAFNQLEFSDKYLLIAGKLHAELDGAYLKQLTTHSNILFIDKFIADSDLQTYLNAADLAVIPYKRIFNSGSVFLNLSFNKVTLVPSMGIFKELETQCGKAYLKLYRGNISAQILKLAMEEIILEYKKESSIVKPDLNFNNPERIALETISFYNLLLRRPKYR